MSKHTTKEKIGGWLDIGISKGSTHVIIAVDTWDYMDYPIYVMPVDNVNTKISMFALKQDRIMEVYDLSMDIDAQVESNDRVWNIGRDEDWVKPKRLPYV